MKRFVWKCVYFDQPLSEINFHITAGKEMMVVACTIRQAIDKFNAELPDKVLRLCRVEYAVLD